MVILFKLSDVTLDLFPDLTKFVDNISVNKQSIIEYFVKEYTSGPFLPDVSIDVDIVSLNIDTEKIEKYSDEFNKATNYCDRGEYSKAKPILERLLKLNPTISDF